MAVNEWLFYTKSNGDVSCMPNKPELSSRSERRKFIGDNGADNFQVFTNDNAPVSAKWDGSKYVSDNSARDRKIADARTDSCLAYQVSRVGGRCDSNFAAMLTSIQSASFIGAIALKPKSSACLLWLSGLWADEDTRDDEDMDFSKHGAIPHSYKEVREEAES